MGTEVIGQQVTISKVKIGGATLSKSMLSGIPIIDFSEALVSLVNGELIVVARYPYQVFNKIKADIEKNLQTLLDAPDKALIRNYAGRNNLVGAVFYDSVSESLLQSWFIADMYGTERLNKAEKTYSTIKKCFDSLGKMDAFSLADFLAAMKELTLADTLRPHNRELALLLRVCVWAKALRSFGGLLSDDDEGIEMMSVADSEQWYKNSTQLSDAELLQDAWSIPDKDLNAQWLHDYLSGSMSGKTWTEQKGWINDAVYMMASDSLGHLRNEQEKYQTAMAKFKEAPIVLI